MKFLFFANTDWYLFNFRRSLAHALKAEGHDVILASPPGPYGEQLRELGFTWHIAPMSRRSLNPITELRLVWWLARVLKSESVDLVHGFTIKCAVYGSIAGRIAGVSSRVSAVTGLGYVFTSSEARAQLLRPIVRALLKMALGGTDSRLIVQNSDDRAMFEHEKLTPKENIRLIPSSGVDTARFSPSRAKLEPRPFRVLLPARMLVDKGVVEFVRAAQLLLSKSYHIQFLMAGEPDPGNPASIPIETIEAWVAQGLIGWLGHVSDMPSLYRSVHVVALPSYREGLPKGLIEAGASGCALVTTGAPGCREVVDHMIDGLIVPVRDAEALAGAIETLYNDEQLCRRLGAAARERVLAEFDERIVIGRTMEVYDELLKRP